MDTNKTPTDLPRQLRRCGDCAHYDALGTVCRRRSPTAIPTPGQGGRVGALVVWPPVNAERDWCGEWAHANGPWLPRGLPAQD